MGTTDNSPFVSTTATVTKKVTNQQDITYHVSELELVIDETAANAAVVLPASEAAKLSSGTQLTININGEEYYFIVTGFSSNYSLLDHYRGVHLTGKSALLMNTKVMFPVTVPNFVQLFDNMEPLIHYLFLGGTISKSATDLAATLAEQNKLTGVVQAILNALAGCNTVVSKLKNNIGNLYFVSSKDTLTSGVASNAFLQAIVKNGLPNVVMTVHDLINYLLGPFRARMFCNGTVKWRVEFIDSLVAGNGVINTMGNSQVERIERVYNALHPTRSMAYMVLDDSNNSAALMPLVLLQQDAENLLKSTESTLEEIFANALDNTSKPATAIGLIPHEETFGTNVGAEGIVPVPVETAILLGLDKIDANNIDNHIKTLKDKLGKMKDNITGVLESVANTRWYDLSRGASTVRVTGMINKNILPGTILKVTANNAVYSGIVVSTRFHWRADGYSYGQYEMAAVTTSSATTEQKK